MAIRSVMSALACAALLGSSAAVSAEASGDADGNKVICKTYQKTGTRFEEKSCRTRTQWEQIRIQQRRDAKEFIDRPTIETRRGG